MSKKYNYKRGDKISGFLRYISEAGYKGKHRYVVTYCELCGSMTRKRLEQIIKGRVKSCGCYHQELIDSGKLLSYSLQRDGKIRGGRWCVDTVCLMLKDDDVDVVVERWDDIQKNIKKFLEEKRWQNG